MMKTVLIALVPASPPPESAAASAAASCVDASPPPSPAASLLASVLPASPLPVSPPPPSDTPASCRCFSSTIVPETPMSLGVSSSVDEQPSGEHPRTKRVTALFRRLSMTFLFPVRMGPRTLWVMQDQRRRVAVSRGDANSPKATPWYGGDAGQTVVAGTGVRARVDGP